MAARLHKTRDFYVYELVKDGEIQYIGKGSGRRLQTQKRIFGLDGYEVARFYKEQHAYDYEIERIAEHQPPMNRHSGGNGCRVQKKRKASEPAWVKKIEAVGSRKYAAQLIMRFGAHLIDPSKVDAIRRIAYG